VLHQGQPLRFEEGRLYQLQRPADAQLVATAAAFEQTSDGSALALIDPSRGAWLTLLTQSPSWQERVQQGGVIGMVIIALAAFGLLIGMWRLLLVSIAGWQVKRQLAHPQQPSRRNPLGRVLLAWQQLQDQPDQDSQRMELQLHQAALREVPALTRAQSLLKLLAAVAPLLGLLGTVTGMILTFQAISVAGAANTSLMAEGIGQALVTTVLGLVAAIPLLFVHNLLSSRSRALIQVLDRESAGLMVTGLTAAGLVAQTPQRAAT
jgi:biopolymer transport protein ExbB